MTDVGNDFEHDPETELRSERIDLDEQFSCLGDSTRRRILTTLAEESGRNGRVFEPLEFKPSNVSEEAFEIEMYHRHLPQLSDAGVIDWNRDSGTFGFGPNFTQVLPLVELLTENRDALPTDWP